MLFTAGDFALLAVLFVELFTSEFGLFSELDHEVGVGEFVGVVAEFHGGFFWAGEFEGGLFGGGDGEGGLFWLVGVVVTNYE